MDAACFDCQFFAPDGCRTADDLVERDWDECLEGECRRGPPAVGRFRGEDERLPYDYGQWPLVQASNWCGAFVPCRRALRRTEEPARKITVFRVADGQRTSTGSTPPPGRNVR